MPKHATDTGEKSMSEFGIPLGAAFYKELANLAWSSLKEDQQNQIRQFLVLRFVDSGTDVLDGCTKTRVLERFGLLLKSGQFDKDIDATLSSKVDIAEIVEGVANGSLKEFTEDLRVFLNSQWKAWLTKPDGFDQKVHDTVNRILEHEDVTKLITAALYRHLQREDVKSKVNSATASYIQSLLDKWERGEAEIAEARD